MTPIERVFAVAIGFLTLTLVVRCVISTVLHKSEKYDRVMADVDGVLIIGMAIMAAMYLVVMILM